MGGPGLAHGAAGRLSLADLCDVAYALVVEDLERDYAADQVAAAVVIGLGGEATVTSVAERRAEFDKWLLAPPVPVDVEQDEWRRAMGIA